VVVAGLFGARRGAKLIAEHKLAPKEPESLVIKRLDRSGHPSSWFPELTNAG
jgi:hypothetical protein